MNNFRVKFGQGQKTKTIRELRDGGLVVSERDDGVYTSAPFTEKIKDFISRHVLTGVGNFPAPKARGAKPRNETSATAQLKRRYESEMYRDVEPYVKNLFRFASSSWAGGKTSVEVHVGSTPNAWGESYRVWSYNGKWSGNNATLSVTVSVHWRKNVLAENGLADAGGMLTTHAQKISDDMWRASWVRQGKGFDLVAESGVIVRGEIDGQTEWVHAKNENSARKVYARRVRAVEAEMERVARRGMSVDELVATFPHIVATVADSRAAGNCATGTKNWIAAHFGDDRESATVSEIYALDPQNPSVKRAIIAAFKNQGIL